MYTCLTNNGVHNMFEYIDQFEERPYKKVGFEYVKDLLIECGSIAFECKLNWFISKCWNRTTHDVSKTTVFNWIERFHDAIDNLENNDVIINANIDSFSDDLDDITDYLIERAND